MSYRKKRKYGRPADYGKSTPKDVAAALLRYRPKKVRKNPKGPSVSPTI